ncbi:uncharacterized protein LOC135343963 isoform X2 [Halichondria panicea]|uniref:uncharacterized protein LOC135343963 isoform X2 n=1 Tax=Halichondria panicea TaxID=6063 RepID=UPI00312B317C
MKSITVLVLLLVSSSNLVNSQTLSITPILVNEGDTVRACVTYTSAPGSVTEIVLSTLDGGAGGAIGTTTGGSDFTSLVETLTFGLGMDLEQCRDIQTLADGALEGFEFFNIEAVLSGTTTAIAGSPQTPTIGNVGVITVGFGETSYQFPEDQGGQVCIVIEGDGSIEGTLTETLTITLTDGTATDVEDFDSSLLSAFNIVLDQNTPASGTCFSLPITVDQSVEPDETFQITINSNNDGQSQLSSTNSQAVVTITNDDAVCGDPPALTEGSFSLSTAGEVPSRRGDTAMYNCSIGYELMGDSLLTCQLGDVWSPASPGTCQGLDCEALSDPANGEVDTASAGTVFPSGIATYSCEDGYILTGSVTRMCQNDGTWSGEAPTCEPRDCGGLSIADGSVEAPQTTVMATATYSCNSGYGLVGESTRTCQADGTWSGSEPTCTQFTCQELELPDNGNVSPREGFEGDMATYTCAPGYRLLGTAARTCQESGSWSELAPICQVIQVMPPGGLSQEQTVGVGVGVGVAGAIILVLVIVAVIILVVYMRRKRADKYVLNYSTVYGNQRKNEMSSRPVEPTEENVYQERSVNSPPQYAEAEDTLAKEQS